MMPVIHQRQRNQKTVKAFDTDIAIINDRAKGLGCSAADIIHGMCEDLRKEIYLQELEETFDLLNAEQLVQLKSEQELWDCTLSDGLSDAY